MITELVHEGKQGIAEHLAHHNINTLAEVAALNNGRCQLCYSMGLATEELDLIQSLLDRVGLPLDDWLDDWTPQHEADIIEGHIAIAEGAELAQAQMT